MSAATTGGQPHSTFVPGKAASTAGKKLEVHDLNNMLSIYIFFVSVCILGMIITDKILQCIYSMITSLWHAVTAIYTQSGYYPVFLYHSSMRLTYPVFWTAAQVRAGHQPDKMVVTTHRLNKHIMELRKPLKIMHVFWLLAFDDTGLIWQVNMTSRHVLCTHTRFVTRKEYSRLWTIHLVNNTECFKHEPLIHHKMPH